LIASLVREMAPNVAMARSPNYEDWFAVLQERNTN